MLNYDSYVVTGGAGFIGSRIAKRIIENKKQVHIIDNLVNSTRPDKSEWWDDKYCHFYCVVLNVQYALKIHNLIL